MAGINNGIGLTPLKFTAGAVLCISLLAGCNLSSADNEQPQQKSESMRVNTVTLTPLTHYDVTREYVGTIQAGQQANLGFELNGKIARLLVDVGDKVNKGEPMVVLDTQLLQTQADQLKAQQAQVTAQLDLVEANLKRQRSLKNKGFSAEAEIDNLNSQRNALRANYRQLGASLAANILQQEKSTIYAPYDGTVSARHISTGDVVNLGAPTLTLLARTQQEAHIGLPAKQLAKLKQQQNWSVRVGNQHYPVSLLNPGARVDLNSRTVQLRFALPADAAVIDGELAYLEFNDRHQNPGYWIPLSSLTDGLRGVWNVFALQEHSQGYIIERRSVQVLYANNEQAYINGAIEANEKIVADGLHRLVPGQTVELIKKLPLPLNNEGA